MGLLTDEQIKQLIKEKNLKTVFCKRKMHIIAAEELTTPDLHFCY